MHYSWVNENHRGKQKDWDAETRKLVRRRAIQAAMLTREKQNGHTSPSSYKIHNIQLWVVNDPLPNDGVSGRAHLNGLTISPEPHYPFRPAYITMRRFIYALQKQSSIHNIFQLLLPQSFVMNEQVRYFVSLVLTDTEYLQTISSCYGRSACLDTAIDCLAARIEDCLTSTAKSANTIRLYVQALQVLQRSIATVAFLERLEIYYAIPLLVLFELLRPSDQASYLSHGQGAVHLLHFIGPDGIQTELDKTLLAMQSDIMATENLRDGHKHCCASLEWHRALRQCVHEDLPPGNTRSEANVTLNIIATAIPDLFNRVESIIITSNLSSDTGIQNALDTIIIQLQDWEQHWKATLHEEASIIQQRSIRMTLLAIYSMYTAIVHRLIAATPAQVELRLESENKALDAANNALRIAEQSMSYEVINQTRLAVIAKLVCSVTETSKEWQQAINQTPASQAIPQTLFATWCARIGRRSTDGVT